MLYGNKSDRLPPRDQERHLYMICIFVKYKCVQKDFVVLVGVGGGGGGGDTSLYNISVSYMFNRGNYIFNQNFQKGIILTKKTNFGIIQELNQLLFKRDFFHFFCQC